PALFQFGADQSPMKHKIEYWTTFMNQETPFFLGPEKIAVSLNFPVVYLDLQRISRGKYYIEYSLLERNPSQSPEYAITEKYVKKIEEAINKNPSNWLWSHKRWKHKKDL
ncbi:MAG: acetyltransferase, partial [Bacteroidetes bacterium]